MAEITPLNPVDAAWYHMDQPANPVVVTGLALLKTPLDVARFKAVIAGRLLRFKQFYSRVVERGFPVAVPHWELDPFFDPDTHIHHIALPQPGDRRALLDLVSDLASTPLSEDRPLWQIHIIDGIGAGGAMVLRFHHCIGDGTAMMALSGLLFDSDPDAPPAPPASPARPQRVGLIDLMFRPARAVIKRSSQTLDTLVHESLDTLRHPSQVIGRAQQMAAGIGTAARSVLKPADPASPLKGRLCGQQRVAFSAPVPLDEVKAIGALTGTKVNDVMVAAMTGALRSYLQDRGAEVDCANLRAVVPVDLRARERALELGNVFGLTFLDLPVSEAEPLRRLRAAKHGMDAIKRSPEAAVFLNLLSLFGQAPKAVEDVASQIFGSKATMVMTNVAGPRETLYLAGSPIEQIVFWVPHPVSLGVGISILSYNGKIALGVITDAGVVPDPETIAAQFNREFALLRDMALATGGQAQPGAAEAVGG